MLKETQWLPERRKS